MNTYGLQYEQQHCKNTWKINQCNDIRHEGTHAAPASLGDLSATCSHEEEGNPLDSQQYVEREDLQ